MESPLGPTGSLTTLRGSLAPDGAIIKTSAASPRLFEHEGPAIVFDSAEDAANRLDEPATRITPDHVLVLRNAGPIAAGMPEAGSLPIPKALVQKGVKDMLRVSDARMSGTAYGTVVLHCTPEAAAGGPLAFVKDGDLIRLSVSNRRIDLIVDENELAKRRKDFVPPDLPKRGWARLYSEHVLQADKGADLDFMVGSEE
jgi:dihydroxy-acid dehydratase